MEKYPRTYRNLRQTQELMAEIEASKIRCREWLNEAKANRDAKEKARRFPYGDPMPFVYRVKIRNP
jgi:hypothetical protein